jgi:hypothetical protein
MKSLRQYIEEAKKKGEKIDPGQEKKIERAIRKQSKVTTVQGKKEKAENALDAKVAAKMKRDAARSTT